MPTHGRFKNLLGKRHERLEIVKFLGKRGTNYTWEARCDCGNSTVVSSASFNFGAYKSCGCLKNEKASARMKGPNHPSRKHGHSTRRVTSPEYRSWSGMIARCCYVNSSGYPAYGGVGILVCDRWRLGENRLTGFECFFQDMGSRPPEHTLDRFPNMSGNYEPSNCRWATRTQQQRNRKTTVFITWKGETMSIPEAVERKLITQSQYDYRRSLGLMPQEIVDRYGGKPSPTYRMW